MAIGPLAPTIKSFLYTYTLSWLLRLPLSAQEGPAPGKKGLDPTISAVSRVQGGTYSDTGIEPVTLWCVSLL